MGNCPPQSSLNDHKSFRLTASDCIDGRIYLALPETCTITRQSSNGLKKVQTVFFRNGPSLAGKMIPHPVAPFCTPLEASNGLIWQKSNFDDFAEFPEKQILKSARSLVAVGYTADPLHPSSPPESRGRPTISILLASDWGCISGRPQAYSLHPHS